MASRASIIRSIKARNADCGDGDGGRPGACHWVEPGGAIDDGGVGTGARLAERPRVPVAVAIGRILAAMARS